MNTAQNTNHLRFSSHFNNEPEKRRRCIIDCKLPSDVIFFLYDYADQLKIQMLVEKKNGREDYAVIELRDENRWIYTFKQLLQTLRRKYNPGRYGGMCNETIREIADLIGWLTVYAR